MDFGGAMIGILILFFIFDPKGFGKQIARLRKGYEKEMNNEE